MISIHAEAILACNLFVARDQIWIRRHLKHEGRLIMIMLACKKLLRNSGKKNYDNWINKSLKTGFISKTPGIHQITLKTS